MAKKKSRAQSNREYRNRRREERKKAGLCFTCTNEWSHPKFINCPDCREKAVRRNQNKIKNGVCRTCDNPIDTTSGASTCEECRAKRRQWAKDRKEKGICKRCTKKTYKEYIHCKYHYEIEKARYGEEKKIYTKAGVCLRCRENDIPEDLLDFGLCKDCWSKRKKECSDRYYRIKNSNQCGCGVRKKPGKTRCRTCRLKHNLSARQSRQRTKEAKAKLKSMESLLRNIQ